MMVTPQHCYTHPAMQEGRKGGGGGGLTVACNVADDGHLAASAACMLLCRHAGI